MGKGELMTLLGNSAVLRRAFGRLWTEEELGRLAALQVLRGMVLQRGQQLFKKVRLRSKTHLDSPRSCETSTKVDVDSALRNMLYRGDSQRQNTFMGVDDAVVCLSVVLLTPMNVIWRCEIAPSQPCFESNG